VLRLAVKGFAAAEVTSEIMHRILADQPDICTVREDGRAQASAAPRWHLDRIDQVAIPLDREAWDQPYNGSGVDVYVVDTGIDPTHVEFQDGQATNIFAYNGSGYELSIKPSSMGPTYDIDGDGHGSHCAGLIGGATVGVAPGASLFGLKVLDDYGNGYFSDVVAGLEHVVQHHQARVVTQPGRRAVVSMSLGGWCGDPTTCAADEAVVTVGALVLGHHIPVVVAAGNDQEDACSFTPAASVHAITVGSSDRHDRTSGFTNYGRCVDIFAPGSNITSVEGGRASGADQTTEGSEPSAGYLALSGE